MWTKLTPVMSKVPLPEIQKIIPILTESCGTHRWKTVKTSHRYAWRSSSPTCQCLPTHRRTRRSPSRYGALACLYFTKTFCWHENPFHSASHWPGPPTVPPSLLDTLTTSFALGVLITKSAVCWSTNKFPRPFKYFFSLHTNSFSRLRHYN